MDDWISHVYPNENAKKLHDVVVVHHTEVVANVHKTDPGVYVRERVYLCVCLCVRESD